MLSSRFLGGVAFSLAWVIVGGMGLGVAQQAKQPVKVTKPPLKVPVSPAKVPAKVVPTPRIGASSSPRPPQLGSTAQGRLAGNGKGRFNATSYQYRGHDFERRTYYVRGKAYERYYRGYRYRGVALRAYAPVRYYPVAYYGWAYHPWVTAVPYVWGWAGSSWSVYYGTYFVPYAAYPSASLWLTDYLIADSLQTRYEALASASHGGTPPSLIGAVGAMTPEVKQLVANEVQGQIGLESDEAQWVGKGDDPDAASSGVARMLQDNAAHVFVAGGDLSVLTSSGEQCGLGQGDVVQVSPPAGTADPPIVNALVLASRPPDCPKGVTVAVPVEDLQEMQNHMREAVDRGLNEMRTLAGQAGGLPALPLRAQAEATTPPFAGMGPPPDANAAAAETPTQQQPDLPGVAGKAASALDGAAAQIDKAKEVVGIFTRPAEAPKTTTAEPQKPKSAAEQIANGARSGTLACAGGPFPQNAEYEFREVPPGPLRLVYDTKYWEAKLVQGEGQTQRLILRNKGPGPRKTCVVHWVLEN